MKSGIFSINSPLVFLLFTFSSVEGLTLEQEANKLAENLSTQFKKKNDVTIRKAVAVLEFTHSANNEAERQAAETMRELMNEAFSNSNLFKLVDRRNLANIIKELELKQMGIATSPGQASGPLITSADILVSGKVSSTPDGFLVAVQLTDTNTAEQYATTTKISRQEAQGASGRIADKKFDFVDSVGLSVFYQHAISGNAASASPIPANNETGNSLLPGIELRYRFSRYFLAGAGFARVYGHAQTFDSVTSTATGNGSQAQVAPLRIVAQGFNVPLNFYFNYAVSRRMHIQIIPGVEFNSLTYHGYFSPSQGNGFGANEVGPFLSSEFFALKIMAGIEFFVTPRMALSLKAGYLSSETTLSTAPLRHLNLPSNLHLNLGGFVYSPAITVYF